MYTQYERQRDPRPRTKATAQVRKGNAKVITSPTISDPLWTLDI